jgi:hypothetical protein
MHLPVLDLEVVFVRGDVFVNANLGFGCALVLDLDFKIERCDTFQSDGDDLFALGLS